MQTLMLSHLSLPKRVFLPFEFLVLFQDWKRSNAGIYTQVSDNRMLLSNEPIELLSLNLFSVVPKKSLAPTTSSCSWCFLQTICSPSMSNLKLSRLIPKYLTRLLTLLMWTCGALLGSLLISSFFLYRFGVRFLFYYW